MSREINYQRLWRNLMDARYEEVKAIEKAGGKAWNGTAEHQAARLALGDYKLECFAEKLTAGKTAPWFSRGPLDAARLYLLEKHHWQLNYVRQLEKEDLLLALHSELLDLQLTAEQSSPVRSEIQGLGVYPEIEPHLCPVVKIERG